MRPVVTYVAHSVICMSVCQSVVTQASRAKNVWTDRDVVWRADSCGPKEPYIRWRSRSPEKMGNFGVVPAHWKSIESLCCGVRSKRDSSVLNNGNMHCGTVRQCAMLPTSRCHNTLSHEKSTPCDAAFRQNSLTTYTRYHSTRRLIYTLVIYLFFCRISSLCEHDRNLGSRVQTKRLHGSLPIFDVSSHTKQFPTGLLVFNNIDFWRFLSVGFFSAHGLWLVVVTASNEFIFFTRGVTDALPAGVFDRPIGLVDYERRRTDWLSYGFTSHPTQNRSFRRFPSQTVS